MFSSRRFALLAAVFISSFTYAQKIDSLNLVLDTAKNHSKVKTLNELFRAYLPSDPLKAIGYSREALSYATEVGDKKGLAASYNNLGVAYRTQGALDKALEYYINALHIYESIDNKEGIATSKNNIANIYTMKRDYSQAMKYLQDSHKLFMEGGDSVKLIGSLNNIGNLNNELLLFDKALEYYSMAQGLSEKKGIRNPDPVANIGNIHFKQKNYQRAVEYYEKALAMEEEAQNKEGILNVITNLAVTYTKARQAGPAQSYLDRGFELCNEIQAFSVLPTLYKAQAENFGNQGKFKDAYEVQLKYDEARERMFGEESTRAIAQMELLLSFEEKEKEFELLKKNDEVKTLELQQTRLFVVVGILAILITLGILNYTFLSRKKSVRSRPVQPSK
jgi:tetratricopeptide (TPR) repeat protein